MKARLVAGLTMLESLVAVAVLGVVLALAAPSVREMVERQHVRGTADEIGIDLRLARTEAVRRGNAANDVMVSFGRNDHLTCYVIHTALTAANAICDCTRPPGSVCTPAGVRQEIKTVQLRRSSGVELSASSPSAQVLAFRPPLGLAMPADMQIDVTGDHGATLRLRPSTTGAVAPCSPGGSMGGVPAC